MGEIPIKDPHVAFAQALVALAREHGVGWLTSRFSLTSSRFFREGGYDGTFIDMSWVEGRHGDKGGIKLKAEAGLTVGETGHD